MAINSSLELFHWVISVIITLYSCVPASLYLNHWYLPTSLGQYEDWLWKSNLTKKSRLMYKEGVWRGGRGNWEVRAEHWQPSEEGRPVDLDWSFCTLGSVGCHIRGFGLCCFATAAVYSLSCLLPFTALFLCLWPCRWDPGILSILTCARVTL